MTIWTDDERELAERYPAMQGKCSGHTEQWRDQTMYHECVGLMRDTARKFHGGPKSKCEPCPCQGRGYVPDVTTDALLDVLFKASWFLDICRVDVTGKWTVEGDTFSKVDGEGDTRHAALVAAVLSLPEVAV